MKDDLRYTATDCFETYPFPTNYETDQTLETVGREYYEFRAKLMAGEGIGLTATYNQFHDPQEDGTLIQRLRDLHDGIDQAVLRSYGWDDIRPLCEFIAEFDDNDNEEKRPSKKRFRYRWTDETRDEVFARLLELNQTRAINEKPSVSVASSRPQTRKKSGKAKKQTASTPALFVMEEEEV